MKNIVITTGVRPERVADLLTNVFETTLWAKVESIELSPTVVESDWLATMRRRDFKDYALAPLLQDGRVAVEDRYDDSGQRHELYTLDRDAIDKGLCRFVSTRHWGDFVAENDDAVTADIFLQLCLFGEVIYG